MSDPFKVTHTQKGRFCPQCKEFVDRASSAQNSDAKPPKEGDIMICLHCFCVCVLTKEGEFRPIDEEDVKGMSKELIESIHEARKQAFFIQLTHKVTRKGKLQ
jgi:hypothetical protein